MAASGARVRRTGPFAATLAGTAALVFLGVQTGGAQPPAPLSVIYSPAPAANAIHDGSTAVPGLTNAVRQAPIFDDPRWPVASQIGKLSGKQLSTMTTDQMVATIQAELANPRWGGLVGIDEITVNDWDEAHAASLGAALQQLGPDADRVIVYAGPALVTQVGGVDLRQSLDRRLGLLVAALKEAGATLLEMYHGTAGPFTREQFAVMPTRWLARWAPADPTRLHMFFGPDQGIGWTGLFAWARATPAGREILANGAGVYGLQTAQQGLDWLTAYREFLAAPTSPPPTGDYPVPVGGGLELKPPRNRNIEITIDRPARAVMRVVPQGQTQGRVIGVLNGPTPGVTVSLPRDLKAGNYDVVVVMQGQGLRDVVSIPAKVGPPVAAQRLRLRYAGKGVLKVSLGGGNRTVIRIIPVRPTKGPTRAIAKLTGPLRNKGVVLPKKIGPGRYRAVAISSGLDGRQGAGIRFTLKR